jgi:hypothetical protein
MILAFTEADHWRPGIGDPTVMGWVTGAAYFIAALFCWIAARTHRIANGGSAGGGQSRMWLVLAILLTLLGINKQLDLQTWFTLALKSLARSHGWYEHRRVYQAWFIAALSALGVAGLVILRLWVGSSRNYPALAGAVLLTCFVVIRAASFHHVDRIIGLRIAGLRLNWVLELGGIFCIGAGAWMSWKRNPQSGPGSAFHEPECGRGHRAAMSPPAP